MMSVIVRVLIITVLLENKLHVTGSYIQLALLGNEECLSENHGIPECWMHKISYI